MFFRKGFDDYIIFYHKKSKKSIAENKSSKFIFFGAFFKAIF